MKLLKSCLILILVTVQSALMADDDWDMASSDDVGLDGVLLQSLVTKIRSTPEYNIHSLLVFRHNKLVLEEYFSGTDQDWGTDLGHREFSADTLHDLRSVSKSVTSALVGIAIAEGKIAPVETGMLDLLPEYGRQLAPDKADLTLHHILSMTAGLSWFEPSDYTNRGNDEIRMDASPDPIAFVMGRSFHNKPGSAFQYNGGLPTLLGYLLERGYGMDGKAIAAEKLFKPLGIKKFEWHAAKHGLLAYASGLRLRPRDMAKIGSLYLNEGRWHDQQVLDPEWVKQSLRSYTSTDWTAGYGYQWWIPRFASEEHSIDIPAAIGNGGQRIYILDELDMMVVMTAGVYNSRMPFSGMQILSDYILPSAGLNGLKFVAGDQ